MEFENKGNNLGIVGGELSAGCDGTFCHGMDLYDEKVLRTK